MSNIEDKYEAQVYQVWSTASKLFLDINQDPMAYRHFYKDLEDISSFIAKSMTAIKNVESLNVSLVGM